MRNRRRGWTLVELLVVLAVIGLLAALVLPAVQQAREASRRTACRNNLRQLTLGLASYETAHRMYPVAWPGCSSLVATLPFVGYAPMYELVDFTVRADRMCDRDPHDAAPFHPLPERPRPPTTRPDSAHELLREFGNGGFS